MDRCSLGLEDSVQAANERESDVNQTAGYQFLTRILG